MEIPPDTLEELKCSVCESYLSRGLVYLQHDGAAVCGVCFSPKRPATRNKQYEATAKLLLFPCKNRDLGCQEKVPFVNEAEIVTHEEVCQHRQYVCPVLGSARCDWLGAYKDILKHCEEQHADKVKDNPTTFTHDISKASEQTFLLRAFQLMFLLHVKICVTSGKIYHAVRYLGRSDEVKNFTFKLDIKRDEEEQITKKGRVAPEGCRSIQEDTSLVLDTNGLLSVLDGFDGTTFTVTVKRLASALEKCAKCSMLMTSFMYREDDGWWCGRCAPAKVDCENKAHHCTHKDIPKKCKKHTGFFCEKDNCCYMCNSNVLIGSRNAHYDSVHETEKHKCGSSWQARWTGTDQARYIRLCSVGGIGMCWYKLNNSRLLISIYIPVTSEQLREFKCVVRVTQTATGQTRTYTPDTVYDDYPDWIVEVKNEEFTAWSHEFDVCVDIIKIEP